MAWCSKRCIFIVLCLLFIHCQQSPDKVTDAFNSVNASLQETNQVGIETNSIEYLYSTIHLNRQKNTALADQAGTLYAVTKEAHSYLEQLKDRILSKDTAAVSVALTGRPLIEPGAADTLSRKLLSVYNQAYTALTDQQKKVSLDSAMTIVKEIRTNEQWASKYFDKVPTIAAVTILSKLQYDCLDAARIALGDINQHLAK